MEFNTLKFICGIIFIVALCMFGLLEWLTGIPFFSDSKIFWTISIIMLLLSSIPVFVLYRSKIDGSNKKQSKSGNGE